MFRLTVARQRPFGQSSYRVAVGRVGGQPARKLGRSGKLLPDPLGGLGPGRLVDRLGQFHGLFRNGPRAEDASQSPLGDLAGPKVHGNAQQNERGHGQGGPAQPPCRRLGRQVVGHGRQYVRAQLRADAARRQSHEQLFDVVLGHRCLANQVCIFAKAARYRVATVPCGSAVTWAICRKVRPA